MRYLTRFLDGSIEGIAPAKVNLYLHITGRRADGYHELDSLFAFTHFGDRIRVSEAPFLTMSVSGPFSASLKAGGMRAEDNLVWRAAKLLQAHVGVYAGAHIRLRKNMPIASGIGGGSADAAATLRALNAFWGLQLSYSDLAEIGLMLGADVPACLTSNPIHVTGIGEQISKRELPTAYGIVLVNNRVPVSTPAVFKQYKALGAEFDAPLNTYFPHSAIGFVECLKGQTDNSLTGAAQSLLPEIGHILHALEDTDGVLLSRMSGSGGTCFALYPNQQQAVRAEASLKRLYPNWWVKADRLQCR